MNSNTKAILNLVINAVVSAGGALMGAMQAGSDQWVVLKSPMTWVAVAMAFFGTLRATWNDTPGNSGGTP